MSTYAERVRESLQKLVEPLRVEEGKIDARIQTLERELADLRPLRTEVRRQLRAITGEPLPSKNGKGPGKSPGRKRKSELGFTEERLSKVEDWLREHADEYPDGFTGSEVARHADAPIPGQTQTAKALRILHGRGVIVLDRVGGPSGRAKFYKLAP